MQRFSTVLAKHFYFRCLTGFQIRFGGLVIYLIRLHFTFIMSITTGCFLVRTYFVLVSISIRFSLKLCKTITVNVTLIIKVKTLPTYRLFVLMFRKVLAIFMTMTTTTIFESLIIIVTTTYYYIQLYSR